MLNKLSIEDKSYLIGLFQGDASLYMNTGNRGKLTYEISFEDKDIILKINNLLKSYVNISIFRRTRNTNFKNNYQSIGLNIYDLEFRNQIKKYVNYGKKSDNIKHFDDLDKINYIRGLTDADGSMGVTFGNRCFWCLCTKSEYIKEFIVLDVYRTLNKKMIINRNKRDNIYNITLYDEYAQEYTNRLYSNANLFIDRKYNLYLSVQRWKRINKKITYSRKKWNKHEDEIVLNRTDKSIKIRKYRLVKLKPLAVIKG